MENLNQIRTQILGGTAGSSDGAITAMQLSSIAYCDDIPATLKKYLPEWKAVWTPTKSIKGQFAFVAFNGSQYAIAIRGSILKFSWGAFDNWFEQDFNIFKQVDWKYTTNPSADPKVSKGTAEALGNLIQLEDDSGDTLVDFLLKNAIPTGTPLCVTGHSLGAYLSTAFAPYLHYQILHANHSIPSIFSVFTFASPTSGNKAFAEEYDNLFPLSWRFYNEIDMIPYSGSDIDGMAKLFPPPGISASDIKVEKIMFNRKMTLSLAMVIKGINVVLGLRLKGSSYSHTNLMRGSVALNTIKTILPVKSSKPLESWFEQVGAQHGHNTYLKLLGSDPLDCSEKKKNLTYQNKK